MGDDSDEILAAERLRVGRQLHDGPIQTLSTALLRLGMEVDPDGHNDATENLRVIEDLLSQAIRELRSTAEDLAATGPLPDALNTFARQVLFKPEIEIDLRDQTTGEQSPATAQTLYLVGREALANIAHHADATSVAIVFDETEDETTMTIVDDGVGIGPGEPSADREHLGLGIMRDRLSEAGGAFVLAANAGRGMSLTASIPKASMPKLPTGAPVPPIAS